MAQPHKGDRAQIMTRPPSDGLRHRQAKGGPARHSDGQYVADLLAEHVGHPELVLELNKSREELPLAM